MSEISLNPSGPPETVLAPEPAEADELVAAALELSGEERRKALSGVLERWPSHLDAWARLGEVARDRVEAYAAFRVGYHRGLDKLRANGWRGSGYVRWRHESNRGFLGALAGLQRTAALIGEDEEASRCGQFLAQLDPDWPPAELG